MKSSADWWSFFGFISSHFFPTQFLETTLELIFTSKIDWFSKIFQKKIIMYKYEFQLVKINKSNSLHIFYSRSFGQFNFPSLHL